MSVDFQRTTQRYIPEDGIPHNHCCENRKPYIYFQVRNIFCQFYRVGDIASVYDGTYILPVFIIGLMGALVFFCILIYFGF
jgi:hypothetical protein